MKVLITGAGGFIGSYLVDYFLKNGFTVHALVGRKARNNFLKRRKSLTVFYGDIRDKTIVAQSAQGMDAIIHLAAVKSDEKDSFEINVGGSENIILASRMHNVKRIIYMSTLSAKLSKKGLYGSTKHLAERKMLKLDSAVIMRPSIVYGNNFAGVFGTIVKAVRLGLVPIIGQGKTLFAPIYVGDLAKAMELLLTSAHPKHKIYDLGGEKVSLDQFIYKIAKCMNKKIILIHLPVWLGMISARAVSLVLPKPPLTVSNILGSTQNVPMNLETFRKEFHFTPIDLDEGLSKALKTKTYV